jgi:hypothetical protein
MKYLALIVLLCCAVTTSAALSSNTGWCTSWTNYDPGGWTETDKVRFSDDLRATIAGTTLDSFAVYTFGAPVPQDATIDSVDVSIEGYSGGTNEARRVYYVALSTNGGVSKNGNWATDTLNSATDAVSTIATNQNGEGNRKWSATLTPATVASANFAVMIKKTISNSTAVHNIDLVQVRVWWTSPTAAIFGRGTNDFKDSHIQQNLPTTNNNTDTAMYVGSNTGSGDATIYIFRVPGLAAYMSGKSQIAGYMVFHSLSNTNPSAIDTLGFQILRTANRFDWDTDTVTYNIYKTATNWGTAGASNTSSDIFATNYSKWDSTHYRDKGYMRLDVSGLLAAYTDSGFTMRELGSGGTKMNFRSANVTLAENRPYLVVWQGGGVNHRRHMLAIKRNRRQI